MASQSSWLHDGRAPLRGHVVGLAGIGTDAERSTEMVEDNRGVGKRAHERGDVRNLAVVAPGFEGQPARSEALEAGSKVVTQECRRHHGPCRQG